MDDTFKRCSKHSAKKQVFLSNATFDSKRNWWECQQKVCVNLVTFMRIPEWIKREQIGRQSLWQCYWWISPPIYIARSYSVSIYRIWSHSEGILNQSYISYAYTKTLSILSWKRIQPTCGCNNSAFLPFDCICQLFVLSHNCNTIFHRHLCD